jgi:ectoine hydroxylase-related dioxygenase (phytanoyl-CoA dioxygenase family)
MQHEKQLLKEQGYVILKKFFEKEYIDNLRKKAEDIFKIQFDRFGYDGDFQSNMIRLFREHETVFINCGKIIQTGLLELYKLPLEDKLINKIKELGIQFPNLCTRPVLFFNHPQLAKEEIYYKTPPHQDWSSMESSMNSVVVWVPLVDVNKDNGSILIWPETHKLGPLPFSSVGGFAKVDVEGDFIQPELEVGDIVIFSTLLIHGSGDIMNDTIRWSCHYRYTDMLEQDYIERDFPNPYVYKPLTKQ